MDPAPAQHPADESLLQVRNWLDKFSPILIRIRVPMAWVAVGTTVLFIGLALWRYGFSCTRMDMTTTANAGQFIGGTVGTILSALASILLAVTLYVQIKEYGLTRDEMRLSIKEQQELTAATRAHLDVAERQQRRSEQEAQLNQITLILRELMQDTRTIAWGPSTSGPYCAGQVLHDYLGFQGQIQAEAPTPDADWFMSRSFMWVLELNLLHQRAKLLDIELQKRSLHEPARQIRRQELVLFIKQEMVPQRASHMALEREIMKLRPTHPKFVIYRQKMSAMLLEIDQILADYFSLDLMQI